MNDEAAIAEVKAFRQAVTAYRTAWDSAAYGSEPQGAVTLSADVAGRIYLIEEIAKELHLHEPERLRQWNMSMGYSRAFDAADELLGILMTRERRDLVLGPAGPSLSASRMHRWVWEPAAELWENGHRREAVQAAATTIFDQQLPAKMGLNGMKTKDLVGRSLSLKSPEPDAPRLRMAGYDLETNPLTYNDVHESAMYLGYACIGVRNLRSHSMDQPPEELALEELAMLSRLARWIDEARVEYI